MYVTSAAVKGNDDSSDICALIVNTVDSLDLGLSGLFEAMFSVYL